MKRELGSFERALVLFDRYTPFHFIYVLQLELPPPSQVIGKAFRILQKRHPLLRARLISENGNHFFASLVDPVVPLWVLPRWNDTHWTKVVEVELATRSEQAAHPMFRCTYLYDENQKHAEILLTFFQSLVDAASAGRLLDELMMVCASLMDEGTVTTSELAPAPPQESRFPSAFRGIRLGLRTPSYALRQVMDEILYQIQTREKRRPPLHKKHSQGHIVSLAFPKPFVASLIHRADLEKVTLDSILHAAQMIAINRHLYAGKNVPMRALSFWDMRPFVEPPLKNENLGCYISPLRHSVPVEGGIHVWELARSLQQKFYRSIKSGDHFVAATSAELLLKIVTNLRPFRLGSTALNFIGDSQLKTNYGEIIINDVHSYVSACDLGPEFSGQVRLFNGQMIWDCTFLEADMNTDEARAILEEIKSILNFAVTSPLFSI